MSWFRWHDGTVRDGKFHIAAQFAQLPVCTIIGVWASLLEDASTGNPRGIASRDVKYHAMFLNLNENDIGTVWNALERVGVIRNGDAGIEIVQWHKRQYQTDAKDPTSKARKHKWKQRHSKIGTERNGLERFGTPDTDTDTDKKDIAQNEFERFWKAYPRRVGKKAAEKALTKALRETTIEVILLALSRQTSSWTDPKFVPHPATWLNAGRWEDELGFSNGAAKPPLPSDEEIEKLREKYYRKQAAAI